MKTKPTQIDYKFELILTRIINHIITWQEDKAYNLAPTNCHKFFVSNIDLIENFGLLIDAIHWCEVNGFIKSVDELDFIYTTTTKTALLTEQLF